MRYPINEATKNHKFYRTEDRQGITSIPIDQSELSMIREEGKKLLDKKDNMVRSCWECNPCHDHFLEFQRDRVLWCFDCGRHYYKGVDITEYE